VAPVEPVGPVGPVAPVALVGPVVPVGPVAPVVPVTPVAPVALKGVKVVLILDAGSLMNTEIYLPFVSELTGIIVYNSTKILVLDDGNIVKGNNNDCVTNDCVDCPNVIILGLDEPSANCIVE
jgi:hypothetical protein